MTYFPKEVFCNILSYCDDTIERQQRKNHKQLNEDIHIIHEQSIEEIKRQFIDAEIDEETYNYYIDNWYDLWIGNYGFDFY